MAGAPINRGVWFWYNADDVGGRVASEYSDSQQKSDTPYKNFPMTYAVTGVCFTPET